MQNLLRFSYKQKYVHVLDWPISSDRSLFIFPPLLLLCFLLCNVVHDYNTSGLIIVAAYCLQAVCKKIQSEKVSTYMRMYNIWGGATLQIFKKS